MPLERSHDVSLIDVIDRVLDKGIVIDYWARVSVLGIDLLTRMDARIIVASVDTYLQFAERIGRTGTLARRLPPAVDVNAARNRYDTNQYGQPKDFLRRPLDVSADTVARDWRMARTWLMRQLNAGLKS
jgi:gas vesicle structural protein